MRALEYAMREGWASLWRSRGSSAFAVVAIALAITVLGVLLLLTWNAQRLLAQWTTAAEFSVYLRDDATSEQRGAIEALIDRSGATDQREYVSKTDALARFRRQFADLASLTQGFDDNPFPASLEVRVRAGAGADGRADALVKRVAALAGVADVRYDREWLTRLASGLNAVRGAGLALALLMAVAAGVTVATVVRLGLHSRRDEIEIMRLVGSPVSFIRGPFVAEGLMQGGGLAPSWRWRFSGWDWRPSTPGGAPTCGPFSTAARSSSCRRGLPVPWWRAAWRWAGPAGSRRRGTRRKQGQGIAGGYPGAD